MKKITIILLVLSGVFFMTCDKNNSGAGSETTVAEDKQNIEALFDRTLDIVRTFENGRLIQALLTFTGLEDGEVLNRRWIDDLFESLDKTAGFRDYVETHERFDFGYFEGKYDYNQSTKRWTKSSDSKLVINFPAGPASKSNNCSVILSEYSDTRVTVNNRDRVYVPSKIRFSVTLDGQEIASCQTDVSWETVGFVTVKEASVTVFTAPFTHTASIRQVKSTEYDAEATLFAGADHEPYVIKTKLKLAQAIDEDFFADDELPVNYVYLTVAKGDLAFDGSLDMNTLNKYNNPTIEQINSVATVNILYKDAKIGDLKLRTLNRDDYVFINYKDDTSENIEIYYEPFLDELDNILRKYNDNDPVIDYRRASAQFFTARYNQLKNAAHALFKTE
ncbi:MAG: hypothetical protein LBR10_15885 [Prevotellaceae bacterium]|jgi:hypothetical protein|nr:hypothetical protein [Prevotellaceae bacterium]